ncbi:mitotic spindle assembly checkpoint protein MAD2B [Cavenderia fasciculata]|uniref:Mitotic spindle assembly checkpoint protein MAD2B n=1 Tax=Cavenderia fasciculata TaxID=261658 RepID=F4PYC9_CACFS|nr:mitotic spindle assembly checkpoint protein MAD2B [Cavenderia fasciculata]EGG19396.1 mitotic spindle assembly checkpoint protein MAD2B [Cavenderia fasciculata]|eukprot:XP_004357667.1 mitotic spindle assembly checkpoint protein MAD2B [Cavenderia fasciculata]
MNTLSTTTLGSNNINNNSKYYDVISEFIEVACHCILYVRGVYDSCLFQRSLKYGIAVPMSRSIQLQNYIAATIDSLKIHLFNGSIDKISIAILDSFGAPIERFMFDFDQQQQQHTNNNNNNKQNTKNDNLISKIKDGGIIILDDSQSQQQQLQKDKDKEFNNYLNIFKESNINLKNQQTTNNQNNQNNQNNNNQVVDYELLERSFQSYLLKLLSSESYLPFNRKDRMDCTFTVYAFTKKRINSINNNNNNSLQIDPLNAPGGGEAGDLNTNNKKTTTNNNRPMTWVGVNDEEYQFQQQQQQQPKGKVSAIPLKSIFSGISSNQPRYTLSTSIEYIESQGEMMDNNNNNKENVKDGLQFDHDDNNNNNLIDVPMVEHYSSEEE